MPSTSCTKASRSGRWWFTRKSAPTSGGFCGKGTHRPGRRHPRHRPATAFFDPLHANPRAGSRIGVAAHLFARGRHAARAPCHIRAVDHQAAGKCSPRRETIYTRSRRPGHRTDCSMRPPRQAYSFLAVPHMPAHFAHCPAGRCLRTYLNRQRVLRRLWFRPSPPCCR